MPINKKPLNKAKAVKSQRARLLAKTKVPAKKTTAQEPKPQTKQSAARAKTASEVAPKKVKAIGRKAKTRKAAAPKATPHKVAAPAGKKVAAQRKPSARAKKKSSKPVLPAPAAFSPAPAPGEQGSGSYEPVAEKTVIPPEETPSRTTEAE